MKTILFPTDFSKCAENAFDYAIGLSQLQNAELILFTSVNLSTHVAQAAKDINSEDQLLDTAKEKLHLLRDKALKSNPELSIECLADFGSAVDNIVAVANGKNADIIVMGTKGATGMKEIFVGTNAASILEKANCQVIVIPEHRKYNKIQKIVFATDLKNSDFSTLASLIDLASLYEAEVMIVHISEFISSDNYAEELEDWFKEELKNSGIISYEKISIHHLVGGNTDFELEDFMAKYNVDLLTLCMRKRTFFSKLFSSSLTKTMAYQAQVPLLVFHARK